MAIKIGAEQLSDEIRKLLNQYGGEVEQVMRGCVKDVAKETAKELKGSSPKDSGDYAKNWTYKPLKVHGYIVEYVVYNKKPTYRVAHLVEFGHPEPKATRGKHYVAGKPHIKPAEQNAIAKIEQQMREAVEAIKI